MVWYNMVRMVSYGMVPYGIYLTTSNHTCISSKMIDDGILSMLTSLSLSGGTWVLS